MRTPIGRLRHSVRETTRFGGSLTSIVDGVMELQRRCAPGGIRTPNRLIRSQILYPLSYGRTLPGDNLTSLTADGFAPKLALSLRTRLSAAKVFHRLVDTKKVGDTVEGADG